MKNKLIFSIFLVLSINLLAQNNAVIRGNFQTVLQSYSKDTLIGAEVVPERVLLNSYANILYTQGNFNAGFRYEGYLNTLKGYDAKNDGFGIPYRFAQYKADNFDITVGNFYDQFGNGLILRTYEDKNIGYDNAFDGIRAEYSINSGLFIKAIVAKQRFSFSKNSVGYSQLIDKGLVRAINFELSPNDLFPKFKDCKTKVLFGASFVSKFQEKQNQNVTINDTTYLLDLPENVAAISGRINISRGAFALNSEYAYKFNDPTAENGYIYKPGNATIINLSYSQKGLGIIVSAKRIDNFGFRSDRTSTLNDLNINYIPDISRNHIYAFSAMYPYVNQNNGEVGISSEITFRLKKETFLGGKYGTNFRLNYSRMNEIQKNQISETIPLNQKGTKGYVSDYFAIGDELLYQDISIEMDKKISKSLKFTLAYQNLTFNYPILRGEPEMEVVYSHIGVFDISYKMSKKSNLRLELEALFTQQDMGNWAMALIEYTYSPHWFIAASDQYNYQNPNPQYNAHYYNISAGYKINSTRLQIGYGRQRAGVVCIGGVCRSVPATNGFMFSLTNSF